MANITPCKEKSRKDTCNVNTKLNPSINGPKAKNLSCKNPHCVFHLRSENKDSPQSDLRISFLFFSSTNVSDAGTLSRAGMAACPGKWEAECSPVYIHGWVFLKTPSTLNCYVDVSLPLPAMDIQLSGPY